MPFYLVRKLGDFLRQLLDPRLDIGLEMLGSLVLGDGAQHLPQVCEPLLGVARLAEIRLGAFIFS